MAEKESLVFHLRHTLEKDSTQASLATAIRGLSSTQARWKIHPDRHSIWQIVLHLINFHEFVTRVVDGWNPGEDDRKAMDARSWREPRGADSEWEADVERLHLLSPGLIERVEQITESRLLESYLGRRALSVQLHLVASHAAYHVGQIRLIRALQDVQGS